MSPVSYCLSSVYELSSLVEIWTVDSFFFLLIYALALFLAGVIVLPRYGVKDGEDALSHFLRDGHWCIVSIS